MAQYLGNTSEEYEILCRSQSPASSLEHSSRQTKQPAHRLRNTEVKQEWEMLGSQYGGEKSEWCRKEMMWHTAKGVHMMPLKGGGPSSGVASESVGQLYLNSFCYEYGGHNGALRRLGHKQGLFNGAHREARLKNTHLSAKSLFCQDTR